MGSKHRKAANLPILVVVDGVEGVDLWGTCSETLETWDSDWLTRFFAGFSLANYSRSRNFL